MCSLLQARFSATGGRMQLFKYRSRLTPREQAFVARGVCLKVLSSPKAWGGRGSWRGRWI
jgi:hypothetical protein